MLRPLMSPVGRVFVAGYALLTVGMFSHLLYQWVRESKWAQEGFSMGRTQLSKLSQGIFAIVFWLLCFAAYKIARLWGIVTLALAGVCVLRVIDWINHKAADKIVDLVFADKGAEWVGSFLLWSMAATFLLFLFLAPYGALCALGLRPCGQW